MLVKLTLVVNLLHQLMSSNFRFWTQTLSTEKPHKFLLYKKTACKMLLRLTPGLDFINVLRTAFTPVGPKSVKRYQRLDWVLTLLGPTSVKAVRRTLMKLTPGRWSLYRWLLSSETAMTLNTVQHRSTLSSITKISNLVQSLKTM